MRVAAIIVCAGDSKRFKKDKVIVKIKNKPIFYHTFKVFYQINIIEQIVLVLKKKNFKLAEQLILPLSKNKKIKIVEGGEERKDSVYNGLSVIDDDITDVLIHDGARPFVSKDLIFKVIEELNKFSAVICAIKSKDTLKIVDDNFVRRTLNRENIYFVQTPQGFRKNLLIEAYNRFKKRKIFDDSQLLEFSKEKVKIIDGDVLNIKITYPEDMILANGIIRKRL